MIFIAICILETVNLAYGNFTVENNSVEGNYVETEEIKEEKLDEEIEKCLASENELENKNWKLEIPAINLNAPIAQGTSQEIMYKYVGHFENTVFWNGNIGLAAHNRGFPINYFEKVKDLKAGDEIIYKTPYGDKTYEINLSTVIEETDWSYLEQTNDNRITLITCVRNKPNKRLCIQAIEKV